MIWPLSHLPGVCRSGADRRGPLGAGPRPRAPAPLGAQGGGARPHCGARPVAYGQGSDSIRSAGFPVRLQQAAEGDIILTVDDDLRSPGLGRAAPAALAREVPSGRRTVPGLMTRGDARDPTAGGHHHGLWEACPDVYAPDQTDPPQ